MRAGAWTASRSYLKEPGEAMPISQELLDILICPECRTPVKLTPDGTGLKCAACRRVYPIKDDIPVMLPEEATKAAE